MIVCMLNTLCADQGHNSEDMHVFPKVAIKKIDIKFPFLSQFPCIFIPNCKSSMHHLLLQTILWHSILRRILTPNIPEERVCDTHITSSSVLSLRNQNKEVLEWTAWMSCIPSVLYMVSVYDQSQKQCLLFCMVTWKQAVSDGTELSTMAPNDSTTVSSTMAPTRILMITNCRTLCKPQPKLVPWGLSSCIVHILYVFHHKCSGGYSCGSVCGCVIIHYHILIRRQRTGEIKSRTGDCDTRSNLKLDKTSILNWLNQAFSCRARPIQHVPPSDDGLVMARLVQAPKLLVQN